MLRVESLGDQAYEEFVIERLNRGEQNAHITATISKLNLKVASSCNKTAKSKTLMMS